MSEKLDWSYFPLTLFEPLIEVSMMGAGKHGAMDFLKNPRNTVDIMNSMKRHMVLLDSPFHSDYDDESKLLHCAHIAWRALYMCYILQNYPEKDNRVKLPEPTNITLATPDQFLEVAKKVMETQAPVLKKLAEAEQIERTKAETDDWDPASWG